MARFLHLARGSQSCSASRPTSVSSAASLSTVTYSADWLYSSGDCLGELLRHNGRCEAGGDRVADGGLDAGAGVIRSIVVSLACQRRTFSRRLARTQRCTFLRS